MARASTLSYDVFPTFPHPSPCLSSPEEPGPTILKIPSLSEEESTLAATLADNEPG